GVPSLRAMSARIEADPARWAPVDLHPRLPGANVRAMEHNEHQQTPPRARARVATRPDSSPAIAGLLLALLLLGLLLL
ncbi:MAG TPA: hypothetical protein VJ978_05435, partial [Nitriliruptoraceae bacterium]|nr:hypothetical protein [Nitriliruptoraceae bacterium]